MQKLRKSTRMDRVMHETKAKVQAEAIARWERAGCKGLLALGTGVGKTKVALDVIKKLFDRYGNNTDVLLVVPTETLRDKGWPDEAEKWDLSSVYKVSVTAVCYASLPKLQNMDYDLVILDEAHNLTELSATFFTNNTYDRVLGLSATPPSDPEKQAILNPICPTIFTYGIDDAVEDEVVADYGVIVVQIPPDSKTKNIPGGTKAKPFKTTEAKNYEYLTKRLETLGKEIRKIEDSIDDALRSVELAISNRDTIKASSDSTLHEVDCAQDLVLSAEADLTLAKKALTSKEIQHRKVVGQRMRLIYGMESKTKVAKKLMEQLLPKGRTLIFAGSIKQCEDLCGKYVYHSKTDDTYLTKFKNKEISYLGAVNALNEGVNIPDLDYGIIVQANSNERHTVQRIGRLCRLRDGHKAKIYLLVSMGTVDEKWVKNAICALNPSRITYVEEEELW